MNFDKPKIWENKRSAEFRKWLAEQIKLAPENWSSDFTAYLEIKKEEEKSGKPSPEKIREVTFHQYLDLLSLTENELKDKKILDIGCHEGNFVIYCLKKGITDRAYGLDNNLIGDALDNRFKEHFYSGNFSKDFPVKDLDRIVSLGAVSLYFNEENKGIAEAALRESLKAIHKNGEIHIGPVLKALRGKLEGIRKEEQILTEIMEKLKEEFNIEWELKPADINQTLETNVKDRDVWAEQALTIKRKSREQ